MWQVIAKVNHKRCNYYQFGGCRNDEVESRFCDRHDCTLKVTEDEKIKEIIERIFMEDYEKRYKEHIAEMKEAGE